MNNRGLTLIELLAVIIIIVVIGAFTAFSVTSKIKEANQKSEEILISSIENAAELYVIENRYDFIEGEYEIKLSKLIVEGYLKNTNLKNPITKESLNLNNVVIITIGINNKITSFYDINQ